MGFAMHDSKPCNVALVGIASYLRVGWYWGTCCSADSEYVSCTLSEWCASKSNQLHVFPATEQAVRSAQGHVD